MLCHFRGLQNSCDHAVPYKNMEVICTLFIYKTCTQIYSIVPNVYLMYKQKIHTGNVIDFDVFFLYTAVRGCVQKVYNRYKLEICDYLCFN